MESLLKMQQLGLEEVLREYQSDYPSISKEIRAVLSGISVLPSDNSEMAAICGAIDRCIDPYLLSIEGKSNQVALQRRIDHSRRLVKGRIISMQTDRGHWQRLDWGTPGDRDSLSEGIRRNIRNTVLAYVGINDVANPEEDKTEWQRQKELLEQFIKSGGSQKMDALGLVRARKSGLFQSNLDALQAALGEHYKLEEATEAKKPDRQFNWRAPTEGEARALAQRNIISAFSEAGIISAPHLPRRNSAAWRRDRESLLAVLGNSISHTMETLGLAPVTGRDTPYTSYLDALHDCFAAQYDLREPIADKKVEQRYSWQADDPAETESLLQRNVVEAFLGAQIITSFPFPPIGTDEWQEDQRRLQQAVQEGGQVFFDGLGLGRAHVNTPRSYLDVLQMVFGEHYQLTEIIDTKRSPKLLHWHAATIRERTALIRENVIGTLCKAGIVPYPFPSKGASEWEDARARVISFIVQKGARGMHELGLGAAFTGNPIFSSHLSVLTDCFGEHFDLAEIIDPRKRPQKYKWTAASADQCRALARQNVISAFVEHKIIGSYPFAPPQSQQWQRDRLRIQQFIQNGMGREMVRLGITNIRRAYGSYATVIQACFAEHFDLPPYRFTGLGKHLSKKQFESPTPDEQEIIGQYIASNDLQLLHNFVLSHKGRYGVAPSLYSDVLSRFLENAHQVGTDIRHYSLLVLWNMARGYIRKRDWLMRHKQLHAHQMPCDNEGRTMDVSLKTSDSSSSLEKALNTLLPEQRILAEEYMYNDEAILTPELESVLSAMRFHLENDAAFNTSKQS